MTAVATRPDSLLNLLVRLSSSRGTGKVEVRKRGEVVGNVVVFQGKVAWAVCRDQPETLGTFLWRLGRITRQQFDDINRLYMEHRGKKKLGVLLEEAGYVSRPVLRRCLLLHTRKAVGCLLSEEQVTVRTRPVEMDVGEDDLFDLEEVMPHFRYHPALSEHVEEADGEEARGPLQDKRHPLRALSQIPGYLASAVVSADGEVVVADAPEKEVDPSLLGVLLVTVLEASSRVVVPTSLGEINFLLMDCDQGTLLARWIGGSRENLAALLMSSDGNLGLAKYKVTEAVPALAEWLERRA